MTKVWPTALRGMTEFIIPTAGCSRARSLFFLI